MKREPLKLIEECTPVTYKFTGDYGWMHATLDERGATLAITSDWGNWAYRWNWTALGDPSLHAFLGRAHCDYVANKLLNGRSGATRFDAQLTAKELQKLIAQRRLEDGREENAWRDGWDEDADGDLEAQDRYVQRQIDLRWSDWERSKLTGRQRRPFLTKSAARDLWEELDSHAIDHTDETLFFERIPEEVHTFLTSEPWDCHMTSPSPEYKTLVEYLLPALAEVCKEKAHLYRAGVGLAPTAASDPEVVGWLVQANEGESLTGHDGDTGDYLVYFDRQEAIDKADEIPDEIPPRRVYTVVKGDEVKR